MKRACILVFAVLGIALHVYANPPSSVEAVPRPDAWWVSLHQRFVMEPKKAHADILFLGDSITNFWERAGRKVWKSELAPLHAISLGIPGDQTQHLLWRLRNGELDKVSSKVVVLLIGVNNLIAKQTPEQVAQGVAADVKEIRARLPDTKIVVLGVLPCGSKENPMRARVKAVNALVQGLADGSHVQYLDLGPKFLAPDGALSREVMPDLLHPSEKGYRLFADGLRPTLMTLLQARTSPDERAAPAIKPAVIVPAQ